MKLHETDPHANSNMQHTAEPKVPRAHLKKLLKEVAEQTKDCTFVPTCGANERGLPPGVVFVFRRVAAGAESQESKDADEQVSAEFFGGLTKLGGKLVGDPVYTKGSRDPEHTPRFIGSLWSGVSLDDITNMTERLSRENPDRVTAFVAAK